MRKEMSDKRLNHVILPPTTTRSIARASSKLATEERWVQDALEDDEAREVLKLLRARSKNQSDRLAG